MKLFIDMDDTLAKFSTEKKYLERMFEEGFFRNLKPYKMVEEINEFIGEHPNAQIYILSACVDSPYCEKEKEEWLKQYIPNLRQSRVYFCKVGENKAMLAQKIATQYEFCYLLDDYSRNIDEWNKHSPYFHAIKRINGFNNKSGRKYRHKVRTFGQLLALIGDNFN